MPRPRRQPPGIAAPVIELAPFDDEPISAIDVERYTPTIDKSRRRAIDVDTHSRVVSGSAPFRPIVFNGADYSDDEPFHHILECVIRHAPLDSLLVLPAVCRYLRDTIQDRLFRHVILVSSQWEGGTTVALASALEPSRLLPLIPLNVSPKIRNAIRVVDVATQKLEGLPDWGARELVRLFPPQAISTASKILVESLSSDGHHAEPRLIRPYPYNGLNHVAANNVLRRALDQLGTRTHIAHLTYDRATQALQGIEFDSTSNQWLEELVIVLPSIPPTCQWSMASVVDGIRRSVRSTSGQPADVAGPGIVPPPAAAPAFGGFGVAPPLPNATLPAAPVEPAPVKKVVLTIVALDRLGARHFGLQPSSNPTLADVQKNLLMNAGIDHAEYGRLKCPPWEEWSNAQAIPELKEPPPPIPCRVFGSAGAGGRPRERRPGGVWVEMPAGGFFLGAELR